MAHKDPVVSNITKLPQDTLYEILSKGILVIKHGNILFLSANNNK